MPRPRLAFLHVLLDVIHSLWGTLRMQRLNKTVFMVYLLLALSLVFLFLSFVPVLSPFVYPLF